MSDKTLNISTSPHLKKAVSTDMIMLHVVLAMLPMVIFGIYVFGINAGLVIITAIVSCVITEHVLCRLSGKDTTISDWSAVITGILLGLVLPPVFPLWMTFLGGVVAIGMGKFLFGGLGNNVFNPALVGRAVLQAAFPVAITTWYPAFLPNRFSEVSQSVFAFPLLQPVFDVATSATPLSAWKFEGAAAENADLAMGLVSGSIGETSAVLILIGGIYLAIRGFLNWRIPLAILLTVYVLSGLLYLSAPSVYPSPSFMLLSGGLMLGAVFMATDMVASPVTSLGVIIYGFVIGVLVVVIRIWGGLPEGVMYAILIGNALSPHIDKLVRYRVYGTSMKST